MVESRFTSAGICSNGTGSSTLGIDHTLTPTSATVASPALRDVVGEMVQLLSGQQQARIALLERALTTRQQPRHDLAHHALLGGVEEGGELCRLLVSPRCPRPIVTHLCDSLLFEVQQRPLPVRRVSHDCRRPPTSVAAPCPRGIGRGIRARWRIAYSTTQRRSSCAWRRARGRPRCERASSGVERNSLCTWVTLRSSRRRVGGAEPRSA